MIRRFSSLAAAAGLVVAACGGDDPPPPPTGAALGEPCEADNDCVTRYCDLEKRLCSAIASVDATAAVHSAVGGRAPILIDSGIRTGMDVIKAKARGAAAAAIGRAALFGAVAGQAGIERVLDILLEEIATGLKLCGVPGFQQIDPDLIAPAG